MKNEKLFNALSGIDSGLLQQSQSSESVPGKRPRRFPKPAVFAACLLGFLLVAAGVLRFFGNAPGSGTSGPAESGEQVLQIPSEQSTEEVPPLPSLPEETSAPAGPTLPAVIPCDVPLISEKTETVRPGLRFSTFDKRFIDYIDSTQDGSYMISPLSFRYALGMALAGASGETKAELLSALGVESEAEFEYICCTFNGFTEYFDAQLQQEIADVEREKALKFLSPDFPAPFRALQVANSLWNNRDLLPAFSQEYRDHVGGFYGAEQYAFDPADVVSRVNSWVKEKTENMIPEILPEDMKTDDLAAVLVNALYFKDSWDAEFIKTNEADFLTSKGNTVRKKYITAEEDLLYFRDDGSELLIVPMKGGVYMAFVLGNTDDLESKFAQAEKKRVKVKLPEIDLETALIHDELIGFLKKYGAEKAFSPEEADFSALTDCKNDFYIRSILQKTRLKLDETGVEAAAATIGIVSTESLPEPEVFFTADKPFSFFIYSEVNEIPQLMFAGRITE